MTWDDPFFRGKSSAEGQLQDVQQAQASAQAFAAILGDGSVVTWGYARKGGNSSAVQGQLKNLQQAQSSDSALLSSLAMDPLLNNVQQV